MRRKGFLGYVVAPLVSTFLLTLIGAAIFGSETVLTEPGLVVAVVGSCAIGAAVTFALTKDWWSAWVGLMAGWEGAALALLTVLIIIS